MIHSRLQARNLILTLICLDLLFVVFYGTDAWVQGATKQPHSLIDLDAEGNLPAWFSSFQLALIAVGLWALGARFRANGRPSRSHVCSESFCCCLNKRLLTSGSLVARKALSIGCRSIS
jgi:predicted hotdog family 3-hydroxylacyl-ACP dehydratase